MTPQDREHARAALERGWLTIDQVATCNEGVEKTGMTFLDVARAEAVLTPDQSRRLQGIPAPRKVVPIGYVALLGAALFLLLGWEIFGTVRTFSQNRRLEQEASDLRRRADEAARAREEEVVELLEKRRRESAEKHLVQGRALALRAEELARQSPTPDLEATLKEATQYYSLFLLSYPDEVPVLVERARVHELRGALPESVVDLRRALALDPSRSDALNPKIHELEALLKR